MATSSSLKGQEKNRKGVILLGGIESPSKPSLKDAVEMPDGYIYELAFERGTAFSTTFISLDVAPNRSGSSPARVVNPVGFNVVRVPIPNVWKTLPEDGEKGYPPSASIAVWFSEPVENVNSQTFLVYEDTGSAEIPQETFPGNIINEGDVAYFVPLTNFVPGKRYVVRLTGEIKSANTSYNLAGPYIFRFETSSILDAQKPSILFISPTHGSVNGGTSVVIYGNRFKEGARVYLGGVRASDVYVESATKISFITPKSSKEGLASLEVINPGNSRAVLHGAFLYKDSLLVSAVIPDRGPATGGTKVKIKGKGFVPGEGTRVYFGNISSDCEAHFVRVNSIEEISAVTPSGLIGSVDVIVLNPDGESYVLKNGFIFDAGIDSLISLKDIIRLYDVEFDHIHKYAFFAAGSPGIIVVDVSGTKIYQETGQTDVYTQQERLGFIDENKDGIDDRIRAVLQLPDGYRAYGLSLYFERDMDYLFVAGGKGTSGELDARLFTYRISENPVTKKLTLSLENIQKLYGSWARDVYTANWRALVAGDIGLMNVDIRIPALTYIGDWKFLPLPAIDVDVYNEKYGVVLTGDYNPDTDSVKPESGVLWILDITSAGMPEIATIPVTGLRLKVWGDYAFIAGGEKGLIVVNLLNYSITTFNPGYPVYDIDISGNIGIITLGDGGILILDLSDPQNIKTLAFVDLFGDGKATIGLIALGQFVAGFGKGSQPASVKSVMDPYFHVYKTNVLPGEVVPLDFKPEVVFTENVDPNTVSNSIFLLRNGNYPVEGTFVASSLSSTVTFYPSSLSPSTSYVFSITKSLKSSSGKSLIASYSVTFYTSSVDERPPIISDISPRWGPASGGTEVVITGEHFYTGAEVYFGKNKGYTSEVSSQSIKVITPQNDPGLVDVKVVNPGGTSAIFRGGFLYRDNLLLISSTPMFGAPQGGDVVRIKGRGFYPPDTVGLKTIFKIRGVNVLSEEFISTELAFVKTPPGYFGKADITAHNPDLSYSLLKDAFGYGLPYISSVTVEGAAPSRVIIPDGLIGISTGGLRNNKFFTTTCGFLHGSFKALVYDLSDPNHPEAVGGQTSLPPQEIMSTILPVCKYYVPNSEDCGLSQVPSYLINETELLCSLERAPDTTDIKLVDNFLYIASGNSGASDYGLFTILNATDLLSLSPISNTKLSSPSGEVDFVYRVEPIGNSAVISVISFVPGDCFNNPPSPSGGSLVLIDFSDKSDPVFVGTQPVSPQPLSIKAKEDILIVGLGNLKAVQYCHMCKPPYPELSLKNTVRNDKEGGIAFFRLTTSGFQKLSYLDLREGIYDIALKGDILFASAPNSGFYVISITNPSSPEMITKYTYTTHLSNVPGNPYSLHLYGNLLFISSRDGGVQIFDVENPAQPVPVSAGNREKASDTASYSKGVFVASDSPSLYILDTPFSYPLEIKPPPDSPIALNPSFMIRFNRAIASNSVNPANIKLMSEGESVNISLITEGDRIFISPIQALSPSKTYTLFLSDNIRDNFGGKLLKPFTFTYYTMESDYSPVISAVSPNYIKTTGGEILTINGSGFSSSADVFIGGIKANVYSKTSTSISVFSPQNLPGPVSVAVINPGGLYDVKMGLLTYIYPLSEDEFQISPASGPPSGGTVLNITSKYGSFMLGATVTIGEGLLLEKDVESIKAIKGKTPFVISPGIYEVRVWNSDGENALAGYYSYELGVYSFASLPRYPPKSIRAFKILGSHLFVGYSEGSLYRFDIFNITIPEHPVLEGSLSLPALPLDIEITGGIAVLALENYGLYILDITNLSSPFVLSVEIGQLTSAKFSNGKFILGYKDGTIELRDGSGPEFSEIWSASLDGEVKSIDVEGERIYVILKKDNNLTLYILDFNNGNVLNSYSLGTGYNPRIDVSGTILYFIDGKYIKVYDLSGIPSLMFMNEEKENISDVYTDGDDLFISKPDRINVIDVPGFTVTKIEPGNGETVSVDSVIKVYFSKMANPASVSNGIKLYKIEGDYEYEVTGSVSHYFTQRSSFAIFTPSLLEPSSTYRIKVNTSVKALDGSNLSYSFSSTFTTVSDATCKTPLITYINPRYGFTDGGDYVDIYGENLEEGITIYFGSNVSQNIIHHSSQHISAEIPTQGNPGPVILKVVNQCGLSYSSNYEFIYKNRLFLSSVIPDEGPPQGGIKITLYGGGFIPGMSVYFGSKKAYNLYVESSTKTTLTLPAGEFGVVDVTAKIDLSYAFPEVYTLPAAFLYKQPIYGEKEYGPVSDILMDGSIRYVSLGGNIKPYNLSTYYYPSTGALMIFDTSGGVLKYLSHYKDNLQGGFGRIQKVGNTLYISARGKGIITLDVSSPYDDPNIPTDGPRHVDTIKGKGNVVDIAVNGNLLFTAEEGYGVGIYSTSIAPTIKFIGGIPIQGGASAVASEEDILVAGYPGGISIFSLEHGNFPLKNVISLPNPPERLFIKDKKIYVSTGYGKEIRIYDIDGNFVKTYPVRNTFKEGIVYTYEVEPYGELLFVSGGPAGLQAIYPDGETFVIKDLLGTIGRVTSFEIKGMKVWMGDAFFKYWEYGNWYAEPEPLGNRSYTLSGRISLSSTGLRFVKNIVPEDGEVVPDDTIVEVTLNFFVNPSSVNPNSFRLLSDGAVVNGSYSVISREDGSIIKFIPSSLSPSKEYTIEITNSLLDVAGNPIDIPFTSHFRTSSIPGEKPPFISSVYPMFGATNGGEIVEIRGGNFTNSTSVEICGKNAVVKGVEDGGNTLIVEAPGCDYAGPSLVKVKSPGGLYDLLAGGYHYLEPVTITNVSRPYVRFQGEENVTLTGSGFYPGSSVSIGGIPAENVEFLDPFHISFNVPENLFGTPEIRITAGYGVNATSYVFPKMLTVYVPASACISNVSTYYLDGYTFIKDGEYIIFNDYSNYKLWKVYSIYNFNSPYTSFTIPYSSVDWVVGGGDYVVFKPYYRGNEIYVVNLSDLSYPVGSTYSFSFGSFWVPEDKKLVQVRDGRLIFYNGRLITVNLSDGDVIGEREVYYYSINDFEFYKKWLFANYSTKLLVFPSENLLGGPSYQYDLAFSSYSLFIFNDVIFTPLNVSRGGLCLIDIDKNGELKVRDCSLTEEISSSFSLQNYYHTFPLSYGLAGALYSEKPYYIFDITGKEIEVKSVTDPHYKGVGPFIIIGDRVLSGYSSKIYCGNIPMANPVRVYPNPEKPLPINHPIEIEFGNYVSEHPEMIERSGISIKDYYGNPVPFTRQNTTNSIILSSEYLQPLTYYTIYLHPGDREEIIGDEFNGDIKFTFFTDYPSLPASPIILSVQPNFGSSKGGENVLITGSNFSQSAQIYFGTNPASGVIVYPNGMSISLLTPPYDGYEGFVDVKVVNPDGSSASLPRAFYYLQPLTNIVVYSPGRYGPPSPVDGTILPTCRHICSSTTCYCSVGLKGYGLTQFTTSVKVKKHNENEWRDVPITSSYFDSVSGTAGYAEIWFKIQFQSGSESEIAEYDILLNKFNDSYLMERAFRIWDVTNPEVSSIYLIDHEGNTVSISTYPKRISTTSPIYITFTEPVTISQNGITLSYGKNFTQSVPLTALFNNFV
jgi:hypothetical protein